VLDVSGVRGFGSAEVGMTSDGEATVVWLAGDRSIRAATAAPGGAFDGAGAQVVDRLSEQTVASLALAETPEGHAVIAYAEKYQPYQGMAPPPPDCHPDGSCSPTPGPTYAPLWAAARAGHGQLFAPAVPAAPVGGDFVSAALNANGAALLTAMQM